jgi:hypothetical protein
VRVRTGGDIAVSASAIGLGALLLFGIQPIVAKRLLPWFGGTAAVWTTCLVFFQGMLLAGYLYAHLLDRRLRPRAQAALHAGALLLSLPALALLLAPRRSLAVDAHPILGVLGILALTIGLPYLLLASTSPLLQAWLARRPGSRPPYRLYALSNLASLVALVGYPVYVEPYVPWRRQAIGWALAYAGFAVLSGLAALRAARAMRTGSPTFPEPSDAGEPTAPPGGAPAWAPDGPRGRPPESPPSWPPSWKDRIAWTLLAACASLLLLAVTLHITQHVPAPLLWVIPLAAYLLTFVICFEWPVLYWRPLWLPVLPPALVGIVLLMKQEMHAAGFVRRGALFVGALFVCCMVCHGEIVRRRPGAWHLTTYYLLIAFGGALGGLFAGVVAPLAFNRIVELPIALLLIGLVWVLVSLEQLWPRLGRWRLAPVIVLPFALGIFVTHVVEAARAQTRGYPTVVRSFYGQLAVRDEGLPESEDAARTLIHGGIIHGTQWLHASRRQLPTTYYCVNSGIGRVLALLSTDRPLRVGLVGLGVGTLVTYGRRGDVYRAYEINPQVVRLAETEFTFLRESKAEVTIVLGDARLRMEAEPPQQFDLLAVDAFSGDAVPGHLMTVEALDLYTRHLAPGGILAMHVSNRFVDFEPVLAAGAHALRRPVVDVTEDGEGGPLCYHSEWIMIPPPDGRKQYPALWQFGTEVERRPGFQAWTDELWSLFPVLRKDTR